MIDKLPSDILRQHKGVSFVGVSTCFYVYDRTGRHFMAKRSSKARDEQGSWEIGGGGLKWGLDAEENLRREVKEEYNATPERITFLGYRDVHRRLKDGTPTHWLALDFAVLVDPEDVKINEPEMFDDSGWYTLDNLPDPLHSQQLTFFRQYRSKIKQLIT